MSDWECRLSPVGFVAQPREWRLSLLPALSEHSQLYQSEQPSPSVRIGSARQDQET